MFKQWNLPRPPKSRLVIRHRVFTRPAFFYPLPSSNYSRQHFLWSSSVAIFAKNFLRLIKIVMIMQKSVHSCTIKIQICFLFIFNRFCDSILFMMVSILIMMSRGRSALDTFSQNWLQILNYIFSCNFSPAGQYL